MYNIRYMDTNFDQTYNIQMLQDVIITIIVINKSDIKKTINDIGNKISNAFEYNKIKHDDEVYFLATFSVKKIRQLTNKTISIHMILDAIGPKITFV